MKRALLTVFAALLFGGLLIAVVPTNLPEVHAQLATPYPARGPQGAQGVQGNQGNSGSAATVSIGTTTTGSPGSNATVTNSGTSSAAILNFTVPSGAVGSTGASGSNGTTGTNGNAATITVGTTTTLSAGASATVTNSGSPGAAVFDFGIPQGTAGTSYLSGTTGSIGGGLLSAASCTSGTATVTGATTAMTAAASPVTYPGDGAQYQAYVSSANTVTVKVCALLLLTPVSTQYRVRVFP